MAYTSTRPRPGTSAPGDGSRTITLHDSQPIEDEGPSSGAPDGSSAVGSLRVTASRNPHHVVWDEGVVDNEGCGKKSSKICCIYHKPRRFDESSSEEDSSDDDSGADSDCDHSHHHPHRRDLDCAQPSRGNNNRRRKHDNEHSMKDTASEPNAYEAAPTSKGKGKGKNT